MTPVTPTKPKPRTQSLVDLLRAEKPNSGALGSVSHYTANLCAQAADIIEAFEDALDFYADERNWQGDTFVPTRLEATCKCLCCYETYSDKGDRARTLCPTAISAAKDVDE